MPARNVLRQFADVRVLGVLAAVAALIAAVGVLPTALGLVLAYVAARIAIEEQSRAACAAGVRWLALVGTLLGVAYLVNFWLAVGVVVTYVFLQLCRS